MRNISFSFKFGLAATLIGLLTFTLHWNLWSFFSGPLPGYKYLLMPGNLTLSHLWHPLFSEELPLAPKVSLILFGQFVVVFVVTLICKNVWNFLRKSLAK